jgi:hypothetical protein
MRLILLTLLFVAIPTTASARACPLKVERTIRDLPRYAQLQRPMSCHFVGFGSDNSAAWAFSHGGRLHWYFGQTHIFCTARSTPTLCVRYRAKIVTFRGHRS